MANTRKLVIEIVGDSRGAERAFKKAGAAATAFHSKLGGMTKALAVAGVAAGIAGATTAAAFGIAFGIKSVKAAISLVESMRRVNAVFGRSAPLIRGWGVRSAAALGLAEDQALEMAGGFGLLLRNLNFAPKSAAAMSMRMVQLAADMATFNKADPADTLDALQRGIAGGTRGLKQYGIVLSTAAVAAEAMGFTHKENETDLTSGELAQARYNLMLRQSTLVTGAFRRQTNRLPTVFKIIRAEVKNLEEQFGVGLLPVVRKVANVLQNKLADPKFRTSVRQLGRLVGTVLYNAFVNVHKWFVKNWPGIVAGFRSAGRILRNMVSSVRQLMIGLGPAVKLVEKLAALQRAKGGKGGALAGAATKAFLIANPATGGPAGYVFRKGVRKMIGRQHGGPVSPGGSYLVGERGPERFVPGRSGMVVPNGGGGVTINGPINLPGVRDAQQFLEELRRIAKRHPGSTRGRHGGAGLGLG